MCVGKGIKIVIFYVFDSDSQHYDKKTVFKRQRSHFFCPVTQKFIEQSRGTNSYCTVK